MTTESVAAQRHADGCAVALWEKTKEFVRPLLRSIVFHDVRVDVVENVIVAYIEGEGETSCECLASSSSTVRAAVAQSLLARLTAPAAKTTTFTLQTRPNLGARAMAQRADAWSVLRGAVTGFDDCAGARTWVREQGLVGQLYRVLRSADRREVEIWAWDASRQWHTTQFRQNAQRGYASDKKHRQARAAKK